MFPLSGTSLGHFVYRVDSNLHLVKAGAQPVEERPADTSFPIRGSAEPDDDFSRAGPSFLSP